MLLSVGDFHFFFGGLRGLKPSHEHCVLCHIPLQTQTGRPCAAAQHSPRALWLLLPLKDQIYVQSLCSMELFSKASWDLKLSLLTTPQHKMYTFITDLTRVWTSTAQTLYRRKQMEKSLFFTIKIHIQSSNLLVSTKDLFLETHKHSSPLFKHLSSWITTYCGNSLWG